MFKFHSLLTENTCSCLHLYVNSLRLPDDSSFCITVSMCIGVCVCVFVGVSVFMCVCSCKLDKYYCSWPILGSVLYISLTCLQDLFTSAQPDDDNITCWHNVHHRHPAKRTAPRHHPPVVFRSVDTIVVYTTPLPVRACLNASLWVNNPNLNLEYFEIGIGVGTLYIFKTNHQPKKQNK